MIEGRHHIGCVGLAIEHLLVELGQTDGFALVHQGRLGQTWANIQTSYRKTVYRACLGVGLALSADLRHVTDKFSRQSILLPLTDFRTKFVLNKWGLSLRTQTRTKYGHSTNVVLMIFERTMCSLQG